MKDIVSFPVLPELSGIDFSDPADVSALVKERRRHMFGVQDDACIDE